MTNSRFVAVEEAYKKAPIVPTAPDKTTSAYYGCKVFNRATMRKYLSSDTRRMVYESIEQGVTLDKSAAEHVAAGMKQWAMDEGPHTTRTGSSPSREVQPRSMIRSRNLTVATVHWRTSQARCSVSRNPMHHRSPAEA